MQAISTIGELHGRGLAALAQKFRTYETAGVLARYMMICTNENFPLSLHIQCEMFSTIVAL